MMTRKNSKSTGIIKGAPSGLVISLLVHAGAFILAGLLVVFSVVKKEEITFVPPPAVGGAAAFKIGRSLYDSNEYILLDRQISTFIPSKENKRSHQFSGEEVEIMEYELNGSRRGDRYAENLVIVTDKRGNIVAHSTSAKWLYENLENLKKMPVGRYMDKTCRRIIPSGPESGIY